MLRISSIALVLLATGGLFGVEQAAAQETYKTPWCENSPGIGKECYQNLAQCQQDQQGQGGFCAPTSDFNAQEPSGYGPFPQRPNQ
jgi:hypothetical protein